MTAVEELGREVETCGRGADANKRSGNGFCRGIRLSFGKWTGTGDSRHGEALEGALPGCGVCRKDLSINPPRNW